MRYPHKILVQTIVKSFYKENAGFFIFLIIVMFSIVNVVDGAGLIQYHYSLILGMLKSATFLLLIFFLWFLYVRKFSAFVLSEMQKPAFSFLSIFNNLSQSIRFRLFLFVESLLLLPVLLYSVFILLVGWKQHFFLQIAFVILYLFALIIGTALLHTRVLLNPHTSHGSLSGKLNLWKKRQQSYSIMILRFIAAEQKVIWMGIQIFTCGIVYLIARNNTNDDYDISFPFLFFNFGILANSILIYRIRAFENAYLGFYPGLPVSKTKRFFQTALVYFIILIPEYLILILLVPVHIKYFDAVCLMFSAYSLLLLMNSITYWRGLSLKAYLKILFFVFCIELILILTLGFVFLSLALLLAAILIFKKEYYSFEPVIKYSNLPKDLKNQV